MFSSSSLHGQIYLTSGLLWVKQYHSSNGRSQGCWRCWLCAGGRGSTGLRQAMRCDSSSPNRHFLHVMWQIKFQLPTSSVSLELHWLQFREKKVSPLSAGGEALGDRHSRWMFEEHKEHIRDGDEGAECSWHLGHVGTWVLCFCINISEKAT